jgi:peptidoglycan hydrolase CwlO-like protein
MDSLLDGGIAGILTGLGALITAISLFIINTKTRNKEASRVAAETSELTDNSIDVIEKIVDSQHEINNILLKKIEGQETQIKRQESEIKKLKKQLLEKGSE